MSALESDFCTLKMSHQVLPTSLHTEKPNNIIGRGYGSTTQKITSLPLLSRGVEKKTALALSCVTFKIDSTSTPWKIHMEHTNHPFRKENDLTSPYDYVPC